MKLTSARKPRQQQQAIQKRSSGLLTAPERPEAKGRREAAKAASPSLLDTSEERVTAQRAKKPISARLAKLGAHKEGSVSVAKWGRQCGDDDQRFRASQQLGCGAWLNFRQFLEGPHAGDWKLYAGIHCDQLTCELCQARRAAKVVQAYHPKVLNQWSEIGPDARLVFVTLTVRNGADLDATWKHLHDSLQRLRSQQKQHRCRKLGAFSNLLGGVGHIETKRGKGGGWHPHYHGVWLVDGWSDWRAWRKAWCQAIGYRSLPKIKLLNSQQDLLDGKIQPKQLPEALGKDLCEVLKYPMKFEGAKPADLWTVASALRRRRRLRPFGCMIGVKLPESLDDGPLDWDAWRWIELVVRYNGLGTYDLASRSQ